MTTISDDRMREILLSQSPDQRETFAQELAIKLSEPIEKSREFLDRFGRGEISDEMNRLNALMEAKHQEIKRIEALVAVYIPHGRSWMMALEMQYATLRKMKAQRLDLVKQFQQQGDLMHPRASELDVEITPEMVAAVTTQREVDMLQKAEAFWWSHDTATAALSASQSIPGSTVAAEVVLPSRAGWWWFDKPIGVDLTGKGHGLAALLWQSDDEAMYFSAYSLDEDDGPAFALGWSWGVGHSWEDLQRQITEGKGNMIHRSGVERDSAHQVIAQISRLFLAGCAWLQQKVVVETSGNIERHRRKQLAREDGVTLVRNDVRVIELRRRDYSGVTHQPTDGERSNAEYSCRWVVSGHWRNQFYATTNERKLIYIMPFVKGPSDKPMREAPRNVYRVSR